LFAVSCFLANSPPGKEAWVSCCQGAAEVSKPAQGGGKDIAQLVSLMTFTGAASFPAKGSSVISMKGVL